MPASLFSLSFDLQLVGCPQPNLSASAQHTRTPKSLYLFVHPKVDRQDLSGGCGAIQKKGATSVPNWGDTQGRERICGDPACLLGEYGKPQEQRRDEFEAEEMEELTKPVLLPRVKQQAIGPSMSSEVPAEEVESQSRLGPPNFSFCSGDTWRDSSPDQQN